MEKPENCIFVIFGASGDLAQRKLVPALFDLYCHALLPQQFVLFGVARSSLTDDFFREKMIASIRIHAENRSADEDTLRSFAKRLFYQPINTSDTEDYARFKTRLEQLDRTFTIGGNYIYYLATPPSLDEMIVTGLGHQKLNARSEHGSWKRIVIEKPFGSDFESAKALNRHLKKVFHENQIFRIDHYLGKETVQNILALRFANGIFEPLWNRNYVDHVEVTAAEDIGIESRGGYYEQAGALRDMVQNHLLQMLGITTMEPPSFFSAEAVRNETVKIFQSLRPVPLEEIENYVVRGQYIESTIKGHKVAGYRQEKDVASDSRTETFVALKFFIDNWRWSDVPFYIRTGKRLPSRVTEAVIYFKKTPHRIFSGEEDHGISGNELIIRVQPNEGIMLKFGIKVPNTAFQIQNVSMDFHYSDLVNAQLPSAYEHLLLDCMLGDATLFARIDAVEACWKFVTPILETWKNNPHLKMYGYPAGSWGPREACTLFEEPNIDWRNPCKNLSSEDTYCEL